MVPPPISRVHPHPCSACTVQRPFCPLPDDLCVVFESLKTSAAYGKGEVVFHEAELCHSVYIVCEGSMKLVTSSHEGKVLLLEFAGPGEILGAAEAMLGDSPYECSAIAAEPSIVAIIPSELFVRFVSSYPQACVRLTVALAAQYKTAQREAKFLAFGETSTARLARLLLEWAEERGEAGEDGVHIPSHVTHTELAQSIGATRETVTRILGILNHSGVIERRADEIIIHSADELTRLAHTNLASPQRVTQALPAPANAIDRGTETPR